MRIKVFVTVYKYYNKSFVRTNQVLKQKFVCTIPYTVNKRDDTAISGNKIFYQFAQQITTSKYLLIVNVNVSVILIAKNNSKQLSCHY